MRFIAATLAAAIAMAFAASASANPPIVKTYYGVAVPVWSKTVNTSALADRFCLGKGNGHVVSFDYSGIQPGSGRKASLATYQRIDCAMVLFGG